MIDAMEEIEEGLQVGGKPMQLVALWSAKFHPP